MSTGRSARPRTRQRPEVQRQKILEAAVEVFSRAGVAEASIGDIANEAGVSRTLLYHYFPGKSQIVDTLLIDAVADIERLVADLRAYGGTVREQIELLVDGYYKILTDRPSVVNLLSCDASGGQRPPAEFERRMRRLRRSLLEWLESLRPEIRADIDPERFLLVGLGGLFIWFFPTPLGRALGARPGTRGKTLEAHKAAVSAILLNGLLGPTVRPEPDRTGTHAPAS